ncbi:hypothetical protein BJX61DRAFT_533240 [Aspergillus egyptiacus]|nr:hypothetical protein BJX61DRAFT_533240 [Aspergillus egyptiacus]
MAAVEKSPAVQRIPRSRSARLADQAATAALYVTHPERSLSLRQPTTTPDSNSLKGTGLHHGYSHASASAALAHARKREQDASSHAADRTKVTSPINEGYSYQAALHALKERNASETHSSRRRAESAPSEAARARTLARLEGTSDPFEDLDKYMNASRVQNLHLGPKMFTATPPVAPELDEHRRKSILEAASMSMAKDMYGVVESKEGGSAGLQRLPTRARSQRSVSKPEAATLQQASSLVLQQALNLQDVAQKRAAEKLAAIEDETEDYRRYYGVVPQSTRSSLVLRGRRRGSNETEQFDIERSKEIRTQMSALRSKLDEVDERREKDRANLLERARKNVDAAIEDMDKRMYAETGQSAAMQRYLDEKAVERAEKGIQDIDQQRLTADKINIGGQKYVEMTDVEDIARSRLQPTFDEIEDLAQAQKAREVEERLDAEQREHLLQLEQEREADMEMEERKYKELLKQEQKAKEEKAWPWKRKSKHIPGSETAADKDTAAAETTEHLTNGTMAVSSGARPQTVEQDQAGPSQTEPLSRQESKLRSWFKDRLRRRSGASPLKEKDATGGTHEEGRRASEPAVQDSSATGGTTEGSEPPKSTQEREASGVEATGGDLIRNGEPAVQRAQISSTVSRPVSGVAAAPEGETRPAPLRSNPVTAQDLEQSVQNGSLDDNASKLDGMSPSEYVSLQQDSKEIVERSSSTKKQREHQPDASSIQELPTILVERDSLRESAAEHALPVPPAITGDNHTRRSSAARGSRFSEDL